MSYPDNSNHIRAKPPSRFARGRQCEEGAVDGGSFNRGPIGLSPRDSDEYRIIRLKDEESYQKAIAARKAYFGVLDFKETYLILRAAITETTLSLGYDNKPTVKITNLKTLSDLVTEPAIKRLEDVLNTEFTNKYQELVKAEAEHTLKHGSDAAKKSAQKTINKLLKFNAILNAAVMLHEFYKYYDGIDLVKHQKGKRKKDADKLKERYCFLALAASRAGSKTSDAYTNNYIIIYEKFYDYEKKLNAFLTWNNVEYNLKRGYSANQREPDRWDKVPEGHVIRRW